MNYLALCCIVKDEHPFLEEWIAFHTLMGVEAFFIFDNESEVPVTETLRHLLAERYITVLHARGKAQQIPCYNHCLREFGRRFAWIGFLDADEFALPVRDGDLRVLLSHYGRHAGLGGNWMPFGSSGHKQRPQGLQITNYTLAMPEWERMTRHIKLFVQPDRIRSFFNPHVAVPRPGSFLVNTQEKSLAGPFSVPPCWEDLQINHYYYRSSQDFYLKLMRGKADSTDGHHIPEKVDPPAGTVEDLKAARYAPLVQALLDHADEGSCAALAARFPAPDTPELAAARFTELLGNLQAQEALILLAKARRRFPGHPLLELLAERGKELRGV